MTVLSEGQGFALVSRAPLFGNTVSARHASAPEGPFGASEPVLTVSPPDVPGAFTYGARVHPDLAAEGLQLLSWNVNCSGDLLADASLYRPRFCAVPWPVGG